MAQIWIISFCGAVLGRSVMSRGRRDPVTSGPTVRLRHQEFHVLPTACHDLHATVGRLGYPASNSPRAGYGN